MNTNQILELIAHPERFTKETSAQLKTLVDKYPYFQTAHLLYIKNLQKTDAVEFSKKLQKAAAHIADRTILHTYLNGETWMNITTEKPKEENKPPVVKVVAKKEEPKKIVAKKPIEEKKPSIAEKVNERIAKIEKTKKETKQPEAEIVFAEIADENQNNDIELIETDDESAVFELIDDIEVVAVSDDQKEVAKETLAERVLREVAKKKKELNEKSLYKNTQLFDKKDIIEIDDSFELDETKEDYNDLPIDKKQQITKRELINRFIENADKHGPIRLIETDDFIDTNIANEEETDDFPTETMAKIYAKQQYYNKAIETYKKLSLKYPEKKTYFASQIKKIKLASKEAK